MDRHLDLLRRAKNSRGIFSLVKEWNSELLWAHYSDSHRGFCIEYDIERLQQSIATSNRLIKVNYADATPPLSYFKMKSSGSEYLDGILSGTKSRAWKYEKEYRLVTDASGRFSHAVDAIRSVTFGMRCSSDKMKELLSVIKGRGYDVYHAYMYREHFRIDREFMQKS
jgi:hypothetical protein